MAPVKLSAAARRALKQQRKAFRKKFGRDPTPSDPIFFDPEASTPQPLTMERLKGSVLEAMRQVGTPPEIVYAFAKTGNLLVEGTSYPPDMQQEWNDAIDEYFELESRARISACSQLATLC